MCNRIKKFLNEFTTKELQEECRRREFEDYEEYKKQEYYPSKEWLKEQEERVEQIEAWQNEHMPYYSQLLKYLYDKNDL